MHHGATLTAKNNPGNLYNRVGRPREASTLFAEILNSRRQKHGDMHHWVADSYQNLATTLTRQGRYSESIPVHSRAFEIYRNILPSDQAVTAYPLLSKGFAEVKDGQYGAAEATARLALGIVTKTAPESYLPGVAHCLVGRALEGQGKPAATASMQTAHAILTGSVVSGTYREFCRMPER